VCSNIHIQKRKLKNTIQPIKLKTVPNGPHELFFLLRAVLWRYSRRWVRNTARACGICYAQNNWSISHLKIVHRKPHSIYNHFCDLFFLPFKHLGKLPFQYPSVPQYKYWFPIRVYPCLQLNHAVEPSVEPLLCLCPLSMLVGKVGHSKQVATKELLALLFLQAVIFF